MDLMLLLLLHVGDRALDAARGYEKAIAAVPGWAVGPVIVADARAAAEAGAARVAVEPAEDVVALPPPAVAAVIAVDVEQRQQQASRAQSPLEYELLYVRAALTMQQAHNNTFRTFSRQNLLSTDQRGFKTVIQEEADTFLTRSQIRLNATVATVRTSTKGVVVILADGTQITADYALCTFSLGVLQHDDVRFTPALPAWKQEAIHSMAMGTYTKIFLRFPEKFWFNTEMALYADHERGRYPVWQSLDHESFFPGCGILFVTVTGEFSRRIESMTDAAVQAEILAVLQAMFPDVAIPDPVDFYFQRWYNDPLFRGSYSNWPANFLSEHQVNLRANVNERLWFAGEATSKKHFGYLHGAYAEGRDIALVLAECIQGGGCVGLEHIDRVRNALPYDVA
ncbi:hypothetical protein NUW54_g7751 [Trametes sanguinea]|uniref:Uncharacterized protein n=1 Tax=Trametes sanguinea TaxID=158606 RepID=A0ACC1PJI8_9APHY|nr:hypothetical protein NUW54_g7751 [Trametes sanguinea]